MPNGELTQPRGIGDSAPGISAWVSPCPRHPSSSFFLRERGGSFKMQLISSLACRHPLPSPHLTSWCLDKIYVESLFSSFCFLSEVHHFELNQGSLIANLLLGQRILSLEMDAIQFLLVTVCGKSLYKVDLKQQTHVLFEL